MKDKYERKFCVHCGKPRATQSYMAGTKYKMWIHEACAKKLGIVARDDDEAGEWKSSAWKNCQ